MKKKLAAAAVASAALGLPLLTASSALADEGSLITVGEGSCVAPWYWEGPATGLNGPEHYSACNNDQAPMFKPGAIGGVLDESCILPWHWEGPGTVLDGVLGTLTTGTPDQPTTYDACNNDGGAPMLPLTPPIP